MHAHAPCRLAVAREPPRHVSHAARPFSCHAADDLAVARGFVGERRAASRRRDARAPLASHAFWRRRLYTFDAAVKIRCDAIDVLQDALVDCSLMRECRAPGHDD